MLNELLFKYIIVGNSGIGKTSIIESFIDKKNFNENLQSTIGVGFYSKQIKLNDLSLKIHVWDTAGLERFFSITKNYFRETSVVIICYDITNINSFKKVKFWYDSVTQECDSNAIIVIVGNKNDLKNRRVSYDQGLQLSLNLDPTKNILFFETNIKNDPNLDRIFIDSAKELINSGITNKSLEELNKMGIRTYSRENLITVKESNVLGCCNIC